MGFYIRQIFWSRNLIFVTDQDWRTAMVRVIILPGTSVTFGRYSCRTYPAWVNQEPFHGNWWRRRIIQTSRETLFLRPGPLFVRSLFPFAGLPKMRRCALWSEILLVWAGFCCLTASAKYTPFLDPVCGLTILELSQVWPRNLGFLFRLESPCSTCTNTCDRCFEI